MTLTVVELVPGTRVPSEQRRRFLDEPGLGAVVLGDHGAVLVPDRLLSWWPRSREPDAARWLAGLVDRLVGKGYRVEDAAGRPVEIVRSTSLPARAKGVVRRALRVPLRTRALSLRRRWWRRRFLLRLRWEAWLAGTELTVDVARDLRVEPGVRFQMRPGKVLIQIGPRCSIGSGCVLRLGGEFVVGTNVDIRHDVGINVKGRLELQGRNVLARGAMVHADLPLVFEWGAMAAEFTTVLDSDHGFDGSGVQTLDQPVHARPIRIGSNSLIGAKSSVMPGVTIGRRSIVGAGSVVTKDVPDGWVATGVPAKPVRQLPVVDLG